MKKHSKIFLFLALLTAFLVLTLCASASQVESEEENVFIGVGELFEKTPQIIKEEALYGECLFYDDFESYTVGDVPDAVYYSKLGTTKLSKADACGEIKIVSGIDGNTGKAIELTGNNANNKYPFIRVFYELDQKGQYTMIADMYSNPAGDFYFSLFNGYNGTGNQADKRIKVNRTGTKAKWTTVSSNYDTGTIDGFTNITHFGFGSSGVSDGEKLYIDNIRVYYRDCYDATVSGGAPEATGTAPTLRFIPNSTITFPKNTFTRENYTFVGWTTSVNSKIYLPGETMNIGDITSLTITANWKVTPKKTEQIIEEEKLYGECLFFDDFEDYNIDEVPTYVYYSTLSETKLYKADQCEEIKIVDGIGDNDTQVIELTGNGTDYQYPFIRVGYKLEKQGKYTMLADMYTEIIGSKWCFFNGYSGTGGQGDKRIMYETGVNPKKWQPVETERFTTDFVGLTSINYFGFGANHVGNGKKIYIDNIRVYYKESYEAEFDPGEGAEGIAPVLKFSAFDTITFPKNPFTKEDYVFAGWKTSVDKRVYQEGEKLTLGDIDELTLTAAWAKFVPQLVRKNSIRDTEDGIQGMRFAGYVSDEDKVYASEIGFIVTRAELLGDNQLTFGTNNDDGTTGVSPDGVKYIYGVTYDAATGTDLIYAKSGNVFGSDIWKDVEGTFFTGVITGIPETAYKEKFVVRPYALINGVYVYGEAMKRSVCDVAENAYNDGNDSDYVMKILNTTGINPGKTVCFFGDSITHDGTFIKELAQTYLNTDKDTPRYEFYNCGISGDTAAGGIKRLDSDLLSYDPDIVIMMFGMNDIGRDYYNQERYSNTMKEREEQLVEYEKNMETIIGSLLKEGIEVILCTPTPFDDISTPTNYSNVGLAQCAEFVRETAKTYSLKVIDHYNNMLPLRSSKSKYWGSDSIHPNALGQHVMAQSVMYSLGYIDEMELTTPMSVFDELNEQRHELSYKYRMTLMVDYNLIKNHFTTVEAKKEQAAKIRDSYTDNNWKKIYQDYIDNIDNIVDMREKIIELTEEMSYKD